MSDWDTELERANGEIAELHVRISFQKEIVKQLAYIREWGGRFLVPIPEARVVS